MPRELIAPVLTDRQRQILAMMADGVARKTMARRLGISIHTVHHHCTELIKKLGAEGAAFPAALAVAIAFRLGLLSAEVGDAS